MFSWYYGNGAVRARRARDPWQEREERNRMKEKVVDKVEDRVEDMVEEVWVEDKVEDRVGVFFR